MTPTPTTTRSASIALPSARRTRSTRSRPSNPATVTPQRRSTPCSRCNRPHASPTIGPTARANGVGSISSTVTSRPRPRHVAATSEPMNPAPITTTRGLVSRRERIARQSSRVRSTKIPSSGGVSGNVRGRAPVATTSPSNGSVSPPSSSTARPDTSSPVARRPSCRSSSRSSYGCLRSATCSGSHSPANSSFDSGGRSYGRCDSAPTSTTRSREPSRRNVSAARSPASEAPTMTIVRGVATTRARYSGS